ncbi:kinase-like domain-containing protein [Xylaria sp. FL1042]|nr:kinase-like domain-containing protein [Xylaria sp. FL1042]
MAELTVFYLMPFLNNATALRIINDPLNEERRCDDPFGGGEPCLRIGLDQQPKCPPRLVSFGRTRDDDIILPMKFSRYSWCYFDFNPKSGQLLLHNTYAEKTQLYDLIYETDKGQIKKRKDHLVMAPELDQCAVVLVHDRRYVLTIRNASFELFAPPRPPRDEDDFSKMRKTFAGQHDSNATQPDTVLGSTCEGLTADTETETETETTITSVPSTHTYELRFRGPLQPKPEDVIRFVELEELGAGAQGKVHKVVDLRNGYHYACKTIVVQEKVPQLGIKTEDEFRKFIQKEVNLVKKLQGNGKIVPYLYTQGFNMEEDINIFMPVYEGSLQTLLDMLRIEKPRLRLDGPRHSRREEIPESVESMTACMLHHILDALQFVHAQDPPVIHGDVKPGNILYNGNQFFLADFGLSNVTGQLRGRFGTEWFMAPELNGKGDRTSKLDIYALGVTVAECLFKLPMIDSRSRMKQAWGGILWGLLNHHSPFYASMLAEDPQSRPTAKEIAESQEFLWIEPQDDCPESGSSTSLSTKPALPDKMEWKYSYNWSSR